MTSLIAKTCVLAGVGALLLACGSQRPAPIAAPPADVEALYAAGRAQHAARRYDDARAAWEDVLRREPSHARARNGLAVLLAEQGDYDGAIAQWRAMIEEGGTPAARAFLLGNLGYALFLRGDHPAALTALQQACVLDPLNAAAWEHLSAVLEARGRSSDAVRMMRQASTLREHDLRADYAASGQPLPSAPAYKEEASPWPSLARTELRPAGAVVEVVRVEGAAHGERPSTPGNGGDLHLEISNGNGVRGMAAAWAKDLRDRPWKSVRLTNAKPFAVPVTRIEYVGEGSAAAVAQALAMRLGLPAPQAVPAQARRPADLRIVLGRDRRPANGKVPAQGTLRAP